MRHRLTMLAATCLATLAAAQGPSAWAPLTFPGGTATVQVQSLGKLVVAQQQDVLHVFSAATRRWHAHPAPGAPAVRVANDWVLWRDATGFTAFSSMRGTFEHLGASTSAFVVNPTNQRNDSIALVRDGSQLHHFSGFDGRWRSRSVGTNAGVSVQRHVAIVSDGNLLGGLSAFAPGWVDVQVAGPATMLSADGTAAVALAGPTVHGFGAADATWSSAAAPSLGATFVRSDDWALWHDGVTALAFSGLQGGFTSTVVGAVTELAIQEDLVAMRSGVAVHLYSPVTASWTLAGLGLQGTLRTATTVALMADGTSLQAYSALRGTLAPLTLDSSAEALSAAVVAALPRAGGPPWLFSALLGQWVEAPADVQSSLPFLATQSALLPTATGWRAWSARSGAAVAHAGPGTPVGNPNSAVAALVDAGHVHVFDARRDVWIEVPRTSPAATPTLQAWRTTLVGHDGPLAVGYGALSGRLETTALPEPAQGVTASSECGVVMTAHTLLAWSSAPEVAPLAQFPEFRRIQPVGSACEVQVQLGTAGTAFLAVGTLAPVPLPLPGLGTLLLDTASAAVLACTPDPGETRHVQVLHVPAAPQLQGSRWWLQAVVLPAAGPGQPWLTGGAELMPW